MVGALTQSGAVEAYAVAPILLRSEHRRFGLHDQGGPIVSVVRKLARTDARVDVHGLSVQDMDLCNFSPNSIDNRAIPVRETPMLREGLYIADEIFFTGTAAEITPIRSVDRVRIGTGRGPITLQIQEEFFGITEGRRPDRHGWLTAVPTARPAAAR